MYLPRHFEEIRLEALHALVQSEPLGTLVSEQQGEPVADARRTPQMEAFRDGQRHLLQAAQDGPLASLPELPREVDAASTAAYIRSVLEGTRPVPTPIALQVEHILREVQRPPATHTNETTAVPAVSPP
jgi:anthranilate phosphoribosyltransferase